MWIKEDVVYNIKIHISEKHIRPKIDVAHGGILAALCDYAMAKSLVMGLEGASVVTTSMSVDFIGAARIGDWIETDVNIIKGRGRVLNAECAILNNGQKIMRSSGVFLLVPQVV